MLLFTYLQDLATYYKCIEGMSLMSLRFKRLRVMAISLFLIVLISSTGLALPRILASNEDVVFLFYAESGRSGDEVDVSVFLLGNPGIAGFSLQIDFDYGVLTPIGVTKNPWLGGEVFVSNVWEAYERDTYYYGGNEEPPYYYTSQGYPAPTSVTVIWGSSSNMTTGELFTIRFRINDDAPQGQLYVSLSVTDLMNEYREDIYARTNYGIINIDQQGIWGNVTGSGYVHVGDLIRLAQHLANIPGMELYGDALYFADVDRDGRVTVADLILMAQYLADPYYIELGVAQ